MNIQLAIDTLNQYRVCSKTRLLESYYPFETKRREAYLENVLRQLAIYRQKANFEGIHLVADDIRHCILHKYYPLLPEEQNSDNFNFNTTLEDVAQLLDDAPHVYQAA